MAMAWLGKNRHYLADGIQRRHILTTLQKCGYGDSPDKLVDELIAQTPDVIDRVAAELPRDFPAGLAKAIFDGLRVSAARLSSQE
ncbi:MULTISPECIES: hypothetical protein [unclassified Janthinobacterium]|uniref:hypothetical protein n=1 Tax=unclassified Janthinobacterium TaxID=2610881 RepID=UPI0003483DC1|nr:MULTISPECIES: hypothetical protein [unclassified Janthinobacterium]MEC5159999.1 hypothetical protein [Janthinobacterium sp. CG_S6]